MLINLTETIVFSTDARRHKGNTLMDRTVLLAVALQSAEGTTAHSLAVRDVAAILARHSSKPLHAVSVYAYPEDRWRGFPGASAAEFSGRRVEQTDDAMRQSMADYIAPLQAEGLEAVTHLRVGEPRDVILQVAKNVEAALLVIGTHSKRSVFDVELGGTAQHVSRHAPCSVVLVHAKQELEK